MVDAIGVEEAGALAGMKHTQLRDDSAPEGWHMCEGWDGTMLICLESVLKSL